jgi:hypothetical protein
MLMFKNENSSSKVAEFLVATDVDWIHRICLVKPFYKAN